ncbi:MAG: polysaccharide deacetylase family protein, partial [Candidatus Omnitrophica bacterium]|nr:polysaccharide deacetylase family protein [Candidatus Omnitrophota bacterium]
MFMKIFKRILLALFLSIFLVTFIFTAVFIYIYKSHYVAPILMYHSVCLKPNPKDKLTVSVDAFQRQMDFLKRNRYNVLPLENLVSLIKEKKRIPPKTIALTFDDGYKDNYTYAFAILKKYHFPATIFVIVNEIGRSDRLSWDEIKEMRDSGLISIGSHTLGAEPLVNLQSEEEIKREIFDSKKILEKKLGQQITSFSYPEGRFNSQIRRLVIDAGYKLAVATSPGKKFSCDDIFVLKRLRISENAKNLFVFWIETS